jgi:hypothetical protein
MNRNSVLSAAVAMLLAFAFVLGAAIAQQKTLKEQLVGSWRLVSCSGTTPFGADFCTNPNGILILDASGQSAEVYIPRGRPKFSGSRLTVNAEQFKAATQNVVANFGTWSVNEADKTLIRHLEGAFNPSAEGGELKNSVSLAGDELKLVDLFPNGPTIEAMYRRAK